MHQRQWRANLPDEAAVARVSLRTYCTLCAMNTLSSRRPQFFTIRTRNLPTARRFYVDPIGLDVVSEKPGAYVQVSISGVPADVTSDDSASTEPDRVERAIETLHTCGTTVATAPR